MKKAKRWLLISAALLVFAVDSTLAGAPFKKVALATTAKSTTASSSSSTTTATTEAASAAAAETGDANEAKADNSSAPSTTKNSKLTGIPQIDYIWDPNLPRELHGYNLSSYPFFATTPPEEDIHFKCDGLHDGFYASIEFKCQVYHHCVYGIRHDFLCANFTAFDQKTFICHFVSDVDCEGSQKYWNRNDDLYMATTTTSTTTTTTEPPPTPRRRPPVRPLRPLRRPQRPVDDYYYDGEEEYDSDYYEDPRPMRRRKPRPRQRKPALDYDEDYYDKRSFDTDEEPRRRRPSSRDRFRDDDDQQPLADDDYELERRKYDRPRSRNNNRTVSPGDRRKAAGRKPLRPAGGEERRSFSDDRPAVGSTAGRKDKTRPVAAVDEADDVADVPPRRQAGRRRINEKRPTAVTASDLDDLDEYEKPKQHQAADQEEAAGEESPPKVKTTPKSLEEFVTPKAAPASVFARPRAPPRIARPVPVNEKKKYQYPVQKTGTTAAPGSHVADDDYYEEEDYDDIRVGGRRGGHPRRRVVDDGALGTKAEEEDAAVAPPPLNRRRAGAGADVGRKQTRPTLRKPVTDKKPLPLDDEEYDSSPGGTSAERYDSRAVLRRRPYAGRTRGGGAALNSARGNDDVDFIDDDYDERPLRPAHRLSRPKAAALTRKTAKKSQAAAAVHNEEETSDDLYETEVVEQSTRNRAANQLQGRRKVNGVLPARLRQATTAASSAAAAPSSSTASIELDEEAPAKVDAEVAAEADSEAAGKAPPTSTGSSGRPTSVRVVKRPFLPSRGGSPYLPRGLQPVGLVAHRTTGASGSGGSNAHTTDSAPLDMGSTISGVRLLEHGAPLLRDSGIERTTLPPRSALPVAQTRLEPPPLPKATLDELYENDYDVTLNDALNPTLKPLSSPHVNAHSHQQLHQSPPQSHHTPTSQHQLQAHNQHHSAYHHQSHLNRNYSPYGGAAIEAAVDDATALDTISDTDIDSVSASASISAASHPSSISASSSSSSSSLSSASNAFVNNNLYNHQLQQQQQQPPQQQHRQQQQQYAYQSIPASASSSSHQIPNQNQASSLSLTQSQAHQRQMQQQMQLQHQQQQHQQQQQQQSQHPIADAYDRDSYFSSTDIRRRTIIAAPPARTASRTDYRGLGTRIAQHFYDDFEY